MPARRAPAPPAARDHHLPSLPGTLQWGGFPVDAEPALVMASGQTVRVDTLSHQGFTDPDVHPHDYHGAFGLLPEEVLADGVAFWESLPGRVATGRRYGGHVLTGPVYVEGAQPGDTLAVEVLDLATRVPYGFNDTGPATGVMSRTYPGWRAGDEDLDIPAELPPDLLGRIWPGVRTHMYRTGPYRGRECVLVADGIRVPVRPFMGVMAVAPPTGELIGATEDAAPPATGVQSSTPPGRFGGNLDVRDLTVGSTLFLPVFQPGGQVFIGDPHSCQGDGEVSGTAVEHSLSGTFRVSLLRGTTTELPWAETPTRWILMGIDWDLDRAMRTAVRQTVDFLVRSQGLTVAEAYSFASIAVDFHVAEVVDRTQVVTGHVPKDVFVGRRRPTAAASP